MSIVQSEEQMLVTAPPIGYNVFAKKKCWICLRILEFKDINEYMSIKKYFTNEYSYSSLKEISSETVSGTSKLVPVEPKQNLVKLIKLKENFILSICKCRKKLAHLTCFNGYIDRKQNGNISVDIYCVQCNYKYEFDYPYNSNFLIYLTIFRELY